MGQPVSIFTEKRRNAPICSPQKGFGERQDPIDFLVQPYVYILFREAEQTLCFFFEKNKPTGEYFQGVLDVFIFSSGYCLCMYALDAHQLNIGKIYLQT